MLPTVPLLRAGGVYNSLDVQDITPAQGGDVVAQIQCQIQVLSKETS